MERTPFSQTGFVFLYILKISQNFFSFSIPFGGLGRGGIFSFSYNIKELYFKRYVYIACLIKRTTIDKDVKHKK